MGVRIHLGHRQGWKGQPVCTRFNGICVRRNEQAGMHACMQRSTTREDTRLIQKLHETSEGYYFARPCNVLEYHWVKILFVFKSDYFNLRVMRKNIRLKSFSVFVLKQYGAVF